VHAARAASQNGTLRVFVRTQLEKENQSNAKETKIRRRKKNEYES
jgi:hypothetical protein